MEKDDYSAAAPKLAKWFWIDIGTACGGICLNEYGVVIDSAPYFKFMRGNTLADAVQHLRYWKLDNL